MVKNSIDELYKNFEKKKLGIKAKISFQKLQLEMLKIRGHVSKNRKKNFRINLK